MKIKLMFKTPDVIESTLTDAVEREMSLEGMKTMDDGWEAEVERRCEAEKKKLERWVKYGEYLWVEIDTTTGQCSVEEQTIYGA